MISLGCLNDEHVHAGRALAISVDESRVLTHLSVFPDPPQCSTGPTDTPLANLSAYVAVHNDEMCFVVNGQAFVVPHGKNDLKKNLLMTY